MRARFYDADYLALVRGLLSQVKERSYELMDPQVSERIADIGCGTGEDALALAESGAAVIGMDIDEEFLAIARARTRPDLPLSFEVQDACAVVHPDGSFDKLRYDRIFQHLDNPNVPLREACRLLRRGGTVQIVDVDYLSLTFFYPDRAMDRLITDCLVDERLPNSRLIRDLPNHLAENGFALTDIEAHPVVINDCSAALRVINLLAVLDRLETTNRLTKNQAGQLRSFLAAPATPFNLVVNLLIVQGRRTSF